MIITVNVNAEAERYVAVTLFFYDIILLFVAWSNIRL